MKLRYYEIIVGKVGTIYQGTSKRNASREYREACAIVHLPGRARGEQVTMLCDGEPVREYQPVEREGYLLKPGTDLSLRRQLRARRAGSAT
jgi:hypothetical protein